MKRLRKLLLIFCIGLIALVAVGFLTARSVLMANSDKLAPLVNRAVDSFGVELRDLSIGDVGLGIPATARWGSVNAYVQSQEDSPLARQAGFEFSADQLKLHPVGWMAQRARLAASNVKGQSLFVSHPDSGPEIGGFWCEFEQLGLEMPVSLRDPVGGLRRTLEGLQALIDVGVTATPISVSGTIGFRYRDSPVALDVRSAARAGGYGLEADRRGVEDLVSVSGSALTPAEIELVSKYPLQAPHMLYIFEYAVQTSLAAANRDAAVPQDAYRHLLWSYLLTKRFGPELAEEITDAHEIGSTTNTEADHRMDYHNNDLGREYAVEGKREDEILVLAKRDPRVVRVAR